jgi:hypothetical protein
MLIVMMETTVFIESVAREPVHAESRYDPLSIEHSGAG